jgi:hypothetical protein
MRALPPLGQYGLYNYDDLVASFEVEQLVSRPPIGTLPARTRLEGHVLDKQLVSDFLHGLNELAARRRAIEGR